MAPKQSKPINADDYPNLRTEEPEFNLHDFIFLSETEQLTFWRKFQASLNESLERVKEKFKGHRYWHLIEQLVWLALEWCDPDRAPGDCLGAASVDLKQMIEFLLKDETGAVIKRSAKLPAFALAFSSNMDDHRTAISASLIKLIATDPDGKNPVERKLSKMLRDACKNFEWQGIKPGTNLSGHNDVAFSNRAAFIWTPPEAHEHKPGKAGFEVNTFFVAYTYQNQGSEPITLELYGSPMGTTLSPGMPGQKESMLIRRDEQNKLWLHPTKPQVTDRKVSATGVVDLQSLESKKKDAAAGKAVQCNIGIEGSPEASNFEIFGSMMIDRLSDAMGGLGVGDYLLPPGCKYKSLNGGDSDQVSYKSLAGGMPSPTPSSPSPPPSPTPSAPVVVEGEEIMATEEFEVVENPDDADFRSLGAEPELLQDDPGPYVTRSLSVAPGEGEAVYRGLKRSLGAMAKPPEKIGFGDIREAALSLAAPREPAFEWANPTPKATKNRIAMTAYYRFALVPNTIPSDDGLASTILFLCHREAHTRSKGEGHGTRHNKAFVKEFGLGADKPVDMTEINKDNYDVETRDVPKADTDSEDESHLSESATVPAPPNSPTKAPPKKSKAKHYKEGAASSSCIVTAEIK